MRHFVASVEDGSTTPCLTSSKGASTMMSDILGRGIYSVPEVALYTGLKPSTVNRWAFGYREYPGIVDPDLPQIGRGKAISFLAMMELYLMSRFLDVGVRPEKFRVAAGEVARIKGMSHPFAFEHLQEYIREDGKDFYFRVEGVEEESWQKLTGRNKGNFAWDLVVRPYLHEVEFQNEYARRWFPADASRLVVLDPAIQFGEPVIAGTRVPTALIAGQLQAGDSVDLLAEGYRLTLDQVMAAKEFEGRLDRAA